MADQERQQPLVDHDEGDPAGYCVEWQLQPKGAEAAVVGGADLPDPSDEAPHVVWPTTPAPTRES